HILLIEGDEKIREEISEALKLDGHSIEAVESSDDARSSVTMRIPALLISDQKLGDDYVDFLDELTRNRKLTRVPVVLMVDKDDVSSALSAFECDIFAIL